MAATLQAGTPLAEQLSSIVQPKLVDIGWSSGGLDDSALAEYIILMLVNGKTQDQIASELSNDLLNLGPEDSGAQDFARWLFEQVNLLMAQANGQIPDTEPGQEQTQAIPSFTTQDSDRRGRQQGEATQDAEMGDAMDTVANVDMCVFSSSVVSNTNSLKTHWTEKYATKPKADRSKTHRSIEQGYGSNK